MAKKKSLNILGIVFAALVLVGLVLVIVGMCTGILSYPTFKVGDVEVLKTGNGSITLFDDVWDVFAKAQEAADKLNVSSDVTIPSRTFTIIAFIVAIVGAVALLAHAVLKLLGKDIKLFGLVGGAVAVVGAILILVAGLVLAGQFNEYPTVGDGYSAGVGVWLGFIGALVAGASGILSALTVGSKK